MLEGMWYLWDTMLSASGRCCCLWGGVLVAAEEGARSNRGSSELTSGLWRLGPGPGKCLPYPSLLSEASHTEESLVVLSLPCVPTLLVMVPPNLFLAPRKASLPASASGGCFFVEDSNTEEFREREKWVISISALEHAQSHQSAACVLQRDEQFRTRCPSELVI